MSISSITPNTALPQTWQNVFQQRRQDFGQLAQALQSGDLSGAQQAFSDLQSLQSSNQPGTNTNSNSSGNPIANDWAALGQALSSGNLSQAQSDFAQLQTDIKSAFQNQSGAQGANRAHHGHHHHHSEVSSSQDSNGTTGSSAGSGTGPANNNSGGGLNIVA
jgi:hypothetical protein